MKKKIAFLLAAMLIFTCVPCVFAAENSDVKIILEDVTAQDASTLAGEAKIKVSVEGLEGDVSVAQLDMEFEGDLKYRSITFLMGENNPEAGSALISPNAAVANVEKRVMPSILSTKTPISFSGKTELFILTFSGEAGGMVTLRIHDLENTYFTIDGQDIMPGEEAEITEVKASSTENQGKTATVKLTLDKVTDFAAATEAGEYAASGLELKITGDNGYEFYTVFNNIPITKGGHRDASVTIPTFLVTETVVDGQSYSVELSGIGYVSYRASNVTFDEAIEITNADFIPGDVNGDGKVDAEDKRLCQSAVDNPEQATAATDFNRDGKTDQYDMKVFEGIEDEATTPAKMETPEVSGGAEKIVVEWTRPEDETVTGYLIQYGTEQEELSESEQIKDPDITSTTLTDLETGTTYYVRIAAQNAAGTGTFSDVVSATTKDEDDSGSGGGSGSGGSGGSGSSSGGSGGGTGGSGISGGNTGGVAVPGQSSEPFTDLGNYAWAKDSIYALKEKGIISGTSDTTYSPANPIKRGDFILILTRMLKVSNEFTENFADVPVDSYYYNAIGSARAAGIAQGSGENFMPEAAISRQDLITLAYRAFLEQGYITEQTDISSLDVFSDKDTISDYAQTAMASMVSAGVIQGSDGAVNPLGNATRAEVAVMCARLLAFMQ